MPKKANKRKDGSPKNILDKRQTSILDLFARKDVKNSGDTLANKVAMGVGSNDFVEESDDDDVQVISVSVSENVTTKSRYFASQHVVDSDSALSNGNERASCSGSSNSKSKLRLRKLSGFTTTSSTSRPTSTTRKQPAPGPANISPVKCDILKPDHDDALCPNKWKTTTADIKPSVHSNSEIQGSSHLKRKLSKTIENSSKRCKTDNNDVEHADKKLSNSFKDTSRPRCLPFCSQTSNKDNSDSSEPIFMKRDTNDSHNHPFKNLDHASADEEERTSDTSSSNSVDPYHAAEGNDEDVNICSIVAESNQAYQDDEDIQTSQSCVFSTRDDTSSLKSLHIRSSGLGNASLSIEKTEKCIAKTTIAEQSQSQIMSSVSVVSSNLETIQGGSLETNAFESQISSQVSVSLESQTSSIESQDSPQYQPYYIENFKLVIETILEDDFFNKLFDEDDLRTVETFRSFLSDQAKKLYVRLFLRKYKWLCPKKIQYPKIATDLSPYLRELVSVRLLADESSLDGLETCLKLLPADELRGFAKKMHVDVSNQKMPMIVEALLKKSRQKTVGAMFGIRNDLEATMLRRVKSLVGPCYHLQDAARLIFQRCMMLFSLTSTTFDDDEQANSQQLFQILQVNRGIITYPTYKIHRQTKIFLCKEDLVRFQTALNFYSDILAALERHDFECGLSLHRQATTLYHEHCADESLIKFESSLPTFLRVYTAGSVYVRVQNQGVEVLQKVKNYAEANTVLEELLNQSVHCQHYRGHWWDRLALNLDQHLKKPDESLDAIRQGLSDPSVRAGRRLALFQRAQKICESPSNKKLKKRIKEFKHDTIQVAPKVTIQGRLLPKSILGAHSHFVSPDSADGSSQDVTLCRVEEVAISHYKKEGYDQGIHGESSTFFVLLHLYFWDIIFMEGIPDVFYNKYQMAPLDMRTQEFYSNRKQPINKRLKWLRKASEEELLERLENAWTQHEGEVCSSMNWERFENLEQAKTLVQAFKGEFMSGVFKRILKDPRHTSSGMPDLVVWNTTDNTFRLVEVKGPGDKLSTKQILWLDYFLSLGATAEVCHVVGVGAKKLRHSVSKESQESLQS